MINLIRFTLTKNEFEKVIECLNNAARCFNEKAIREIIDNNVKGYLENRTEETETYEIIYKMTRQSKTIELL